MRQAIVWRTSLDARMTVAHYVEYLLSASPAEMQKWLSQFDGFWVESENDAGPLRGEFRIPDVDSFLAEVALAASRLCLPEIKYSWLIAGDRSAESSVAYFERSLLDAFPDRPCIRIDELLIREWEADAGKPWDELSDPCGSLNLWLKVSGADPKYYRILAGYLPAE